MSLLLNLLTVEAGEGLSEFKRDKKIKQRQELRVLNQRFIANCKQLTTLQQNVKLRIKKKRQRKFSKEKMNTENNYKQGIF